MTARSPVVPRICPACNAIVLPNRGACISCGMQVSKMAEYAAASRAARRSGVRGATSGADPVSRLIRRSAIGVVLIGGLVLAVLGYRAITGRASDAWRAYPTDRDALVKNIFTLIQDDSDASFDKAYALISARAKDPQHSDDVGEYRQTFHDLSSYLTGEFGPGWADTLRIERDDGNGLDRLDTIVSIQTEKLHVALDVQRPDGMTPDQLAMQPESSWHYGVRAIEGFPIGLAAKSQKMAIIGGYLRGMYGADGSVNQLNGIVATAGSPLNETPIETKRRLLPVVRDPKAPDLQRALHQLWPVRNDPTVRARLESIMGDSRYDPQMRAVAKRVHDGTEDEAALIADGVNLPG